ncbi:zinc ribbon domain-containing protein [Streptomyces sp. CA-106110]|uniref:zinc ribbon domain-containing protein n=1 Tax=Streptomyces sp. CA-106110 TaxID=3240044 RepID=UPI003D93F800
MSRKPLLADGETSRTACARTLVRTGVDEKTGEVLTQAVLAERIGWCSDLVAGMVSVVLAERWNSRDVKVLASGVDEVGRNLPSNAWMALRRLGWSAAPHEGVKVNDRIVRMAQEQAGRALRSVKWRADVVLGMLATWPADPSKRTPSEWDAVRAAVPGGKYLPSSIIKARTRQAATYLKANGRLPVDVFELEGTPRIPRLLLLKQATIERSETGTGQALLRLQLPTRPDPATYRDWTWVACPIALPPTVPAAAVLHLPTLRCAGDTVRADLAYTHAVPKAHRTGHTVALGVDWGLNTLLSAGAVQLNGEGRITTLGAGAQFRAADVLAKQHRLRRLSERLHTKADQYMRLIAGHDDHQLAPKLDVLRSEIAHVSNRRSNLNDSLAWVAARWAVDQAIAAGATVIYVEDLRSMEAGGMGRTLNTRLSQQVRGQIADRTRHLATEQGIAVVTVPARNTSKLCPHCLTPLRHRKASDRPTIAGWKWAICPHQDCRWQGDRDHGAWRRIAARGLAHQATTVSDRTSSHMVIRTVLDNLEANAVLTPTDKTSRKDRTKTGPTRPRSTRPAPRRRRAPSPARPRGRVGQRPEGHAHTDRTRLPRAAHRHQGVNTISTPTTSRHRPRGAALGAGFHLHAHASPPRWETIPETQSNSGSHS